MKTSEHLALVSTILKQGGKKGLGKQLQSMSDGDLLKLHNALAVPAELLNKEIEKRDIY